MRLLFFLYIGFFISIIKEKQIDILFYIFAPMIIYYISYNFDIIIFISMLYIVYATYLIMKKCFFKIIEFIYVTGGC